LLGFDVPVQPLRRQCFTTEPFPELPHPIPMTVDYGTGVYLHSESGGVLAGKADKSETPGFKEDVDDDFIASVAELATARVPALERARLRTAWAGLYEVTPDHHPLIGEIGDGVWIAAGFSGHGVMHAPATGALMAELLTTGRSSLDVTSLRPSRFREGRSIVETNVI
jgi:sarcosine oxidase subunit beta